MTNDDETRIGGYEWWMKCGECGGDVENDGGPLERWDGDSIEHRWPHSDDRVGKITDGTTLACRFCGAEYTVEIRRTDSQDMTTETDHTSTQARLENAAKQLRLADDATENPLVADAIHAAQAAVETAREREETDLSGSEWPDKMLETVDDIDADELQRELESHHAVTPQADCDADGFEVVPEECGSE